MGYSICHSIYHIVRFKQSAPATTIAVGTALVSLKQAQMLLQMFVSIMFSVYASELSHYSHLMPQLDEVDTSRPKGSGRSPFCIKRSRLGDWAVLQIERREGGSEAESSWLSLTPIRCTTIDPTFPRMTSRTSVLVWDRCWWARISPRPYRASESDPRRTGGQVVKFIDVEKERLARGG